MLFLFLAPTLGGTSGGTLTDLYPRSRLGENFVQLKQSTARNVSVFMTDSSDRASGKTGLTLTIWASKNCGTPAAITPTVTELDSTHMPGEYGLALTTTHTNTLGELDLTVTGTGADASHRKFEVVPELPGNIAGTIGSKLAVSVLGFLDVVVGVGSTTTSIVLNSTTGIDGGVPSAVDDFYNGAVLIFTTGALYRQRTSVTDYVASTKTLTVVALTNAPSNGDTAFLA